MIKRGYSTREAAAYLGCSYQQLKNARSSLRLWGQPAPKPKQMGPKKYIYDVRILDAFLDSVPDDILTGKQPDHLKVVP